MRFTNICELLSGNFDKCNTGQKTLDAGITAAAIVQYRIGTRYRQYRIGTRYRQYQIGTRYRPILKTKYRTPDLW